MKPVTFFTLMLGIGITGGAAAAEMTMPGEMPGMNHEVAPMTHMEHHKHGHGPTGVTGRHILPEGRFALTYHAGHMEMSGNRSGTTDLDPTFIATTVPNRFFGVPGQPPTLRVVPTEMDMTMHMLGAMYGATDRLTLGAMVPFIRKSMTSTTFAGPAGAAIVGTNRMTSEGLGDIRLGLNYRAFGKGRSSLLLGLGVSLPTGSITETGPMLTPAGTFMVARMAYGMQLGSGTVDLHPSLIWQDGKGRLNWGAQLAGAIRLGSNDAGYSLGDEAMATAWLSYQPSGWISYSGRVEAKTVGHIDGIDPNIVMPTQGADPLNYGGESVTLYGGVEFSPQSGALRGHKLGIEVGVPVYQNLNGVQLKRDWSVAVAWHKMF